MDARAYPPLPALSSAAAGAAEARGPLMWLALDTASDWASVAVGEPGAGHRAVEENLLGARRHAAALLPMVQSLLARAGASLDGLRGIILSDGPGSFTGLRVGASVAKALAHARLLPLWTAPSLLVRATQVGNSGDLVLAVSNALRGEVYAGAYRFTAEGIRTELVPSVRRPEDIVALGFHPDIVVGEAAPPVLGMLEEWSGRPVVGPPEGAPHAA